MKPYYDRDGITIYHGDCLDVMAALDVQFDLVFTSPPYNLGVTTGGGFGHWKDGDSHGGGGKWSGVKVGPSGMQYTDHDDAMPYDEYRDWQRDVLRCCWSLLSETGAIFYNHKPRVQASTLWLPFDLNPDLPLRQIITWARSGGMNFAPTHFVPTYEWVMVFAKDGFRLKSRAASGIGDVWRVNQERGNPHPAPFPIGLPARAIDAAAPTVVLDPFMGSGTTLRAARDAGVRAVGIERSEEYCELAVGRLSQQVLDLSGGAA